MGRELEKQKSNSAYKKSQASLSFFKKSIDCMNMVRCNNMAEVSGSARLSRHLSVAAG